MQNSHQPNHKIKFAYRFVECSIKLWSFRSNECCGDSNTLKIWLEVKRLIVLCVLCPSFSSSYWFCIDWWKLSRLFPYEDRSYRMVQSVLMAYLCMYMSGAQMYLWVYECIYAYLMCACLRFCVYSCVWITKCSFVTCIHTLSVVFMSFPGCSVQAVVVGWAMLGSGPIEMMPDGLISVWVCERERVCVCNYRAGTKQHRLIMCACVCSVSFRPGAWGDFGHPHFKLEERWNIHIYSQTDREVTHYKLDIHVKT